MIAATAAKESWKERSKRASGERIRISTAAAQRVFIRSCLRSRRVATMKAMAITVARRTDMPAPATKV
ncbi:MAG: hypothetical protein A4E72_01118 [Syntrophus sp. PtaU1.Bin208]|nr:MAG: hypothetical protein A4E72_01118 [Syntrophus sp. PtaU1.Bin208]